MRTPTPRAAKAIGMKTPIFKSIPTRQVASSKTKKEKQTARVIFPQVQSKADSHIKEVAVSKPKSHVEKEAFISKKIFDAFCAEIIDEKIYQINLFDSQFLILNELLPSLNAYRRESIMTHPSATREEEPCNEHFNDNKSESVVQDHCQENKENIGSSSKSDMHREVDLGTEEQIMTTPKIQELTTDEQRDEPVWYDSQNTIPDDLLPSLDVYSKRFIFLYDSYESFGHYSAVFTEIEKLAAIIPLCLQQPDFYIKKGIDVENHSRYKDKDSSYMFDVLFQENLPQQSSESLDYGLYMVTYAECLPYDHKVLANEFDPNALRIRYAALLWDYETQKQDTNAHSDVEEPLRPAKQSRITSVTEVFDV
ncbi:hypothetical protein FXO37_15499 [Capsicum annuum]|nr:hypothetical protein FXO37_15499 [Capsicum annuum]